MSLNAYGDDKGAMGAGGGAGALSQAPRLRAGCYAAWKPDMDVYLARIGADGVTLFSSVAVSSQITVNARYQVQLSCFAAAGYGYGSAPVRKPDGAL